MRDQSHSTITWGYGLAIVPLVVLVAQVPQALSVLTSNLVWLFIAGLVIGTMAHIALNSQHEQRWNSFILLSVVMVWAGAGLGPALLMLAGVIFLTTIWTRWQEHEWPDMPEMVGSFILNGNMIITAHVVYTTLGETLPIARIPPWQSGNILAGSLLAGYVVLHLSTVLLYQPALTQIRLSLRNQAFTDALSLLMGVVLSPIFYQMGTGVFMTVAGLVLAFTLRIRSVYITLASLDRRRRELEALTTVSQSLATDLELDQVLDRLHQQVSGLIPATTFFVGLYDDETHRIEFPLIALADSEQAWGWRPLTPSLTSQVIRTRAPVMASAAPGVALVPFGDAGAPIHAEAYLGIPLIAGGKIVGVIGVMDAEDTTAFDDDDLHVLHAIANQAGLALRNANLYHRTLRLSHDLTRLNRALEEISFNLDVPAALQQALTLALEITGAQKAAIFRLSLTTPDQFDLLHMTGFDGPIAGHAPYQIARYRLGPRIVPDVNSHDDIALRAFAQDNRFIATAEIPLRSAGSVVGCIVVYHPMAYYYPSTQIELLDTLSNQISALIDNAELLEALEGYASEQSQLVQLSHISSSNLDLERIVLDVSTSLCHMFHTDLACIYLVVDETDHLHQYGYRAHGGSPIDAIIMRSSVPEFEQILEESYINPVFHERQSLQRSVALAMLMEKFEVESVAFVPMVIDAEKIGFLALFSAQPGHFGEPQRRLLELATHQLTGQIQNARIHAQTEAALLQRLQQLALIEDLARQISRDLDVTMVIHNVLDATLQSTQGNIASLGLQDENGYLRLITHEWIDGHIEKSTDHITQDEGIIGHVIRTGETLISGDHSELGFYVPGGRGTYHSSLTVPVHKGAQIIGALNVESIQFNYFKPGQAEFLQSLAGHAIISIDNAALLADRQHQIQVLTQLRDLALNAQATLSQAEVMQGVTRISASVLGAAQAAIYEYDPYTQTFEVATGGFWQEAGRPQTFHIPPILLREAMKASKAQVMPLPDDLHSEHTPIAWRTALAAPIPRPSQIIYLLACSFNEQWALNDGHRYALDLLLSQISGLLENAKLNAAIIDQNNRMRAILDTSRDGILLLDSGGRVRSANRAAAHLLGVSEDELLAHPPDQRAELAMYFEELLPQIREVTATAQREYPFSQPDGTRIHIKENCTAVRDEQGQVAGHLLILSDATEENLAAEYRERIRSMILHDLRGPLGSIMSGMYLALQILEDPEGDAIRDQLQPTLEVALDSADNLLGLVDTLRDLPRLEQGQMPLEAAMVPIADLSHKAYQTLSALMAEYGLAFVEDIPPDLPDVWVDSDIIRRVLVNLLHNAFKFTPEGGTILITADQFQDPDKVRVMVCDTGPGIPEAMRTRVFNEFEQIEGLRPVQGGKGSGLGLTFCKLAVEAHGGRIWVESKGRLSGACFAFTLPTFPMRSQLVDGKSIAQTSPPTMDAEATALSARIRERDRQPDADPASGETGQKPLRQFFDEDNMADLTGDQNMATDGADT